jgi:hypothetical protein
MRCVVSETNRTIGRKDMSASNDLPVLHSFYCICEMNTLRFTRPLEAFQPLACGTGSFYAMSANLYSRSQSRLA